MPTRLEPRAQRALDAAPGPADGPSVGAPSGGLDGPACSPRLAVRSPGMVTGPPVGESRGGGPAGPLRRLLACLCAAVVLLGCGERRETLVLAPGAIPLAIALDGPPTAPLAPLYAAIGGGDFTRAGLRPTILSSPGSSLERLAAGAADVAVASEPDLLRARDKGAALVAIGALVQSPLAAIISIAPHPITKVTRLEGATVAAARTPLAGAELDTILRAAGVAPTSVRRRDPAGDPARALVSKVAAASLGSWNIDAVRLARRRPSVIKVEDAGVPTYNALVLVVRQSEARNRGSVLRTFLQALSAGVRTTVTTPAVAIDHLVAANPGQDRHLGLASLKATLTALDPAPTGSPYGFVDPRLWRTFGRWMLAHGLLTRPDDGARALTNEFLPGQGE